MVINEFRELRVYKQGLETAMGIFELTKAWPLEERYSLTDQIRRSSRPVCANIAEAWRKRRYPGHFVSKLSDAEAEASETQAWLDFALQCGYILKTDDDELNHGYEVICGGLTKMMADPSKWCMPPKPDN